MAVDRNGSDSKTNLEDTHLAIWFWILLFKEVVSALYAGEEQARYFDSRSLASRSRCFE